MMSVETRTSSTLHPEVYNRGSKHNLLDAKLEGPLTVAKIMSCIEICTAIIPLQTCAHGQMSRPLNPDDESSPQ